MPVQKSTRFEIRKLGFSIYCRAPRSSSWKLLPLRRNRVEQCSDSLRLQPVFCCSVTVSEMAIHTVAWKQDCVTPVSVGQKSGCESGPQGRKGQCRHLWGPGSADPRPRSEPTPHSGPSVSSIGGPHLAPEEERRFRLQPSHLLEESLNE